MSIYIISDLHLQADQPEVFTQFKAFLNEIADKVNTLYILGDFFEYWIGDDHGNAFYDDVTKQLKKTHEKGLKIYFMHGNRDFLVGEKFAAESSVRLISDPFYLSWKNQCILLTHGDLLCTEDKAYLRYRKIVQSQFFKWLFLKLPRKLRLNIAAKMRKHSHNRGRYKLDIDATDKGISRYAKRCNMIIHGHTHRLAIHEHPTLKRYVLGDWYKNEFSFIKIDDAISLYDSTKGYLT